MKREIRILLGERTIDDIKRVKVIKEIYVGSFVRCVFAGSENKL